MELSDPHRLLTFPDFQRGRVDQPPAFWVAEGSKDRLLAILVFLNILTKLLT
jgi:hypothetical protein